MLHTKFRENQSTGSGEEGFFDIWAWQPFGHDLDHLCKVSFPLPKEVPLIGQAVSEEKIFENGGCTMDGRMDRRTPAQWVYYKLTL